MIFPPYRAGTYRSLPYFHFIVLDVSTEVGDLTGIDLGMKSEPGHILVTKKNLLVITGRTDNTVTLRKIAGPELDSTIFIAFEADTFSRFFGDQEIKFYSENFNEGPLLSFLSDIGLSIGDGTSYTITIPADQNLRGFFLSIWFFEYSYAVGDLGLESLVGNEDFGILKHPDIPIAPHFVDQLTGVNIAITRSIINQGTKQERPFSWDRLFIILKLSARPIFTEARNPQSPFLYRVF